MRRFIVGAVAITAVVAAGAAYWRHGTPAAVAQAPSPPAVVPVVHPRRADLADDLRLSAEFLPFQEINVHAKVSGYVRQMKVDVGDRVKAGEVLAVLEIPELDSDLQRARAATERAGQDVIRAKAAYEEAHLTFERMSEVLKQQPNLVAQQEIDQARARDETLRAAWIAAQSEHSESRATEAKYGAMVAYSRITAPFDGVVTKRLADTGSLVGAGTGAGGQALVRLSQLTPLRLVLPVPESEVSKVRVGTPVRVTVQSTGRTLDARVARTSGRVATETRTMHVEVDVPNADLALAPGMYAIASLTLESRPNALSLPLQALQDHKDATATVLVLDAARRIEERKVGLGLETPSRIEVVSGLAESDLVVMGGRGRFAPGQAGEPRLVADGSGK
jgi:RND family efflux transporter MFP subunit